MSTRVERPATDVIDLKHAMHPDLVDTWVGPDAVSARPRSGLASVARSLAEETHSLRRSRLRAAAVVLAGTFGVLLIWVFASNNPATLSADGSRFSIRIGFLVLRCLLAATVAGLLASEARLTVTQLRVAEYVLFLGLALVLMGSEYFVGLDLMRRGPEYLPMVLAFVKDGVIQMTVLMMIYGTLIPNPPAVATRTLAAMFAVPVIATFLLKLHPDAAPMVAQLASAEEAGSNFLFLAIGAVLAVYGSFLINGMRVQLHQARKFGQYKLVRKLGEGGMGEVYLAEHQLLKRPCALKLIRPASGSDPIALARFEREVQSAARLSHPNSIEIFDYGHTEDGTFYYIMEYLQGLSLSDLVREAGSLPPGRVIYLFRQACAALAEAHDLGLVHRDLKPANLFVAVRGGESDVAKILDFGLVKLTKDPESATLTAEMRVTGTPQYMAPEQAVAERLIDARADIYALGGTMYFALAGDSPFAGGSAFELMMANARDPVVPLSEVRPDVPEDLAQVVLRCLEKKPDDRFLNVRILAEALAKCVSAAQWGPHRADAWWAARAPGIPDMAPDPPDAAGQVARVGD